MTYSSTTSAQLFKLAFYNAITSQFAADPNFNRVRVIYGQPAEDPSDLDAADILAFRGIQAQQEWATESARRSRNELVSVEVLISCVTFGTDDDQAAETRVFAILNQLATYTRTTDITVGGTVLWCRLAEYQTTGETDPQILAQNRCIELTARFDALARITS